MFTIVEDKAKKKEDTLSKVVTSEDLTRVFPDLFESQFSVGREATTPAGASSYMDLEVKNEQEESRLPFSVIPPEMEIVKDPSNQIQPTGTEGFAQLFKSRYEKLCKIFQERPEGRQIVNDPKTRYGERQWKNFGSCPFKAANQEWNGMHYRR